MSEHTADINRIMLQGIQLPWDKVIISSILIVLVIVYVIMTIRKAKSGKDMPINKKVLICDLAELFVPTLIIIVIMTQVIGVSRIQSGSMEPTLKTGSTVFYNRLCYKVANQEIRRGDIICFYDPASDKYLSKRVIGLPDDKISFLDGYVVINGQICDESAYLKEDVKTNCEKTFEVPNNSYFVLGDNRKNSYDSRYWDDPYVSKGNITGRFMGQLDFYLQ